MKTFIKIMALFMLAFCFTACSEHEEPEVVTLDVNYANLNGTWYLSEWNGQPLPDGVYFYVIFNRADHSFKIYQNMDSMYARLITGTFEIQDDPYLGFVLSGEYDNGNGEWNNEYIVTDLLETGSMIWTVKDDADDVSKYQRCDGVPEEIVREAE